MVLPTDALAGEQFNLSLPIVAASDPQDALTWEVQPHGDRPSFDCNLTEFAVGSTKKDITPKPTLIREMAPVIRASCIGKPKSSVALILVYLRQLWRFFDYMATLGMSEVTSCEQVTHAHGQLFKTWLLQDSGLDPSSAKAPLNTARHLLSDARRMAGSQEWKLLWPNIEQKRGTEHKDVDPVILRPLYSVLKARHAASLRSICEGAELLKRGVDPRLIGAGDDITTWSDKANIAVLARDFLDRPLAGATSVDAGMPARFRTPSKYGLPAHGPSYLPANKKTPGETVFWFTPDYESVAASFLLATLHMGWNLETVAAINVTSDATWCDWRLGMQNTDQTGTVAIYGHKGRVGKEQVAFSLSKPSAHPYRVIKAVTEHTEVLRVALRERLAALESIAKQTVQQRREAEAIEIMIRSPWLFLSRRVRGPGGRIGCVTSTPLLTATMRSFCWKALKVALRMHKAEPRENRRRYLALMTLTPSDLRDGFAAFLYDNSLYNTILVKQALGHSSERTTRNYLRQRQQIAQRFKEFSVFQENLFDEIGRFAKVDPTIVFLRARFGDVTDEQRQRLSDYRNRTRLGMGCLDPTHPPTDLVPDHKGGICAVQRCTLCRHGVLFKNSLPGVAIRMAELRFIRSRASSERFMNSSFQTEWMATDFLLSNVYKERLGESILAIELHLARLEAGEVYLFDQVPPSFFDKVDA